MSTEQPTALPDYPVACDNCEWQGTVDTGRPLDGDWYTRLDPGGEVPACECPKCGSFAYLVRAVPGADEVMAAAQQTAQVRNSLLATVSTFLSCFTFHEHWKPSMVNHLSDLARMAIQMADTDAVFGERASRNKVIPVVVMVECKDEGATAEGVTEAISAAIDIACEADGEPDQPGPMERMAGTAFETWTTFPLIQPGKYTKHLSTQMAALAAQITYEDAIRTLLDMATARRNTIIDLYDIPNGITALTTDNEMAALFAEHGLNHVDLNWHPAESDIDYAKEYRNLCRAIAVLTPGAR